MAERNLSHIIPDEQFSSGTADTRPGPSLESGVIRLAQFAMTNGAELAGSIEARRVVGLLSVAEQWASTGEAHRFCGSVADLLEVVIALSVCDVPTVAATQTLPWTGGAVLAHPLLASGAYERLWAQSLLRTRTRQH